MRKRPGHVAPSAPCPGRHLMPCSARLQVHFGSYMGGWET
jgi:hypothetical protein